MFISESLAMIMFRLTNFVLFCAMMAYFFRKYALQQINDGIEKEEKEEQLLQEEVAHLEQEKKDLALSAKQQKEDREQLTRLVLAWQQVVEQEQKERERWCQKKQGELKKMQEKKAKIFMQHKLMQRTVPEALQLATQELQKKYASSSHQEKYLDTVIDQMTKAQGVVHE